LWTYRREVDARLLGRLIPGALAGIVVGALVFKTLDVRWVKGLLGVECLVFALHRIAMRRRHGEAPPAAQHRGRALFWSGVSGFTSTIAHAGGPPLLQYLLPLRIGKLALVATTVYFFAVVNYVKLVPYGLLGLLETSNLRASLLLAPAVPVGYWIGHRFTRLIPERAFMVFIDLTLVATGAKLLWDALAVPPA
jgi:uncharacterized membrane protein YfcA